MFQILKEFRKLRYVNVNHHSMIAQKIAQQNLKLVYLREHFNAIHVHP